MAAMMRILPLFNRSPLLCTTNLLGYGVSMCLNDRFFIWPLIIYLYKFIRIYVATIIEINNCSSHWLLYLQSINMTVFVSNYVVFSLCSYKKYETMSAVGCCAIKNVENGLKSMQRKDCDWLPWSATIFCQSR